MQEHAGFQYTERITWPKARALMLIPTNALVIMQARGGGGRGEGGGVQPARAAGR